MGSMFSRSFVCMECDGNNGLAVKKEEWLFNDLEMVSHLNV